MELIHKRVEREEALRVARMLKIIIAYNCPAWKPWGEGRDLSLGH